MTRTLGDLIWRIIGDTSQFDKAAKGTSAKAKKLASTGNKTFGKLKLSSIGFGVSAAAAFKKVVDFSKESIQVSIQAQEVISKYGVVFQDMGDEAEEAAARFADAFDLADVSAKEMLSNTGNLLQGFGATRDESLKMAVAVNTLASDLASFTNNQGGAKVASEALTKALLGEREQAKTLGIAILESDVQMRLAKKGQENLTGEALKLAKAQVTLELIIEQAKNSIGDYARTADSAANTQKRAEENTIKLQVALGNKLNPAAVLAADIWSRVAGSLADVIEKQNELRDARKTEGTEEDTTQNRIIRLENEIATLEAVASANMDYLDSTAALGRKDRESLEAKKRLLDGLKQQADYEKALADQRAEGSRDTEKAEKAYALQVEENAKLKKESDEKAAKTLQDQINARKDAEKEYQDAVSFTAYQVENGLIDQKQANEENLSAAESYIKALYALGYAQESELGTKGRAALDELIAKYPELKKLTEEAEEQTESFAQKLEKELGGAAIGALTSGFEELGSALADADTSWGSWAKFGLDAVAAVLRALGATLAAQAAVDLGIGFFDPKAWAAIAPTLAGSAAAYAAAGLVSGWAGSFEEGGIVPGNSYTGDNMIARVNSGERIFTAEQNSKLDAIFDAISAGALGGETTIPVTLALDGKVISRTVTKYQRSRKQ